MRTTTEDLGLWARIVEGYVKEGLSIRQLSRRHGLGYGPTRRILVDAGVTFRSTGCIPLKAMSANEKMVAARMYREGCGERKIAKHFGAGLWTIRAVLDELSVRRRPRCWAGRSKGRLPDV